MPNPIARKLATAFQQTVQPTDSGAALSAREREILDQLTQGLSNKEIAVKLNLSPFTVKNHLARVFEKLHARCRIEAVIAYLHPALRPQPEGVKTLKR